MTTDVNVKDLKNAGFSEDQIKAILSMSNPTVNNVIASEDAGIGTRVVDMRKKQTVTTLHDLQTYAGGTIIRLPDFAEGQPLVVRATRPSLLKLASESKIPNSLLNAATELFAEGNAALKNDNTQMLKDMYSICRIMAEATLISPTLEEIESAGMTLTDQQLMAIFSYTQAGVKALEDFR